MLNKKSGIKVLSAVTALTLAAGASCLSGMEKENLTARAALAGDVNGDGAVNANDISALKKFLVGLDGSLSGDADVNGDGSVNVFDAVAVRRIVMQNPVSDENNINLNGSSISIEGTGMELSDENRVVTIS